MRLRVQCISCLITVRLREIYSVLGEGDEAVRIATELISYSLKLFKPGAELTRIASDMFMKLISMEPRVIDYYRLVKEKSIKYVLGVKRAYEEILENLSGFERFRTAVKIAIAGNMLDAGVAMHKPKIPSPEEVLKTPFTIDHTSELYEMVRGGSQRILYLLDNAGESVLDALLIRELRSMGNIVIAAAKEEPGFQNDATINDAIKSGVDREASKLVSTGTPTSSIHLDKISNEFKEEINKADLIIAKGMAHYEYMSEIELGKPVFFLLIPKCPVIAEALGADMHTYVVKRK